MTGRIAWTVVSVAGLAAALTLGSALFSGSVTRADGAKNRLKESADKDKAMPKAEAPLPAPPAVNLEPTAPAPAAPIPAQATPPATPYYPAPPAPGVIENRNDPRDGSLTVQEIFQLRALKKRVGGENLKRLVDALAD